MGLLANSIVLQFTCSCSGRERYRVMLITCTGELPLTWPTQSIRYALPVLPVHVFNGVVEQAYRSVRSHYLRVGLELHVRLLAQRSRRCRRSAHHYEQVTWLWTMFSAAKTAFNLTSLLRFHVCFHETGVNIDIGPIDIYEPVRITSISMV
jgi:hypothetical protein